MRVLTVAGTRPEIVKLSRTIARFDQLFEHRWIHTGQNWSRNLRDVFLEELGVREPDAQGSTGDGSPSRQVGQMMAFVDSFMDDWTPDAFVVLGDTNSALTAYVARRRKVPVFHVEAGNRCFDTRTPEELNRKIIDHVSDVNMPYTEHGRHNLLREGVRPDRVFVVGSPYREVIEQHRTDILKRACARRLGFSEGRFLLASLHREENVDDTARRRILLSAISSAGHDLGCDVVVMVHPRTRRAIELNDDEVPMKLMDSLGMIDFLSLALSARCVISDSGSLTEEASILGFPAVTLRRSHERPEGMDVGAIAMSSPQSLTDAVRRTITMRSALRPQVDAYASTDVSWRISNIVASYTSQVADDYRAIT